jgi:dihydrodipicolinate synthase/N-acetylneuraminate lyase
MPELLLALNAALEQQASSEVERLSARLRELLQHMEPFPPPVAIKAALAARGLKTGPLPVPLARETREALDEFREWFKAWR